MSERKSPPVPPVNRNSAPANLDRQRKLREMLESIPHLETRRLNFQKGDSLIREGEVAEGAHAFLVMEGALLEQQTRYLPGRGQVAETLFDVQPTQVAFVQALITEYATQPAYTNVVADADGYALLVQREDLRLIHSGALLAGEFRVRLQLLEPLWEMKRQTTEMRSALDAFEVRMAHARGILARNNVDQKAIENALAEERRTARRLQTSIERLQGDAMRSREEAQQTRAKMREAVAALDEERQRMQLRAQGEELYLDRVRRTAIACGLSADELELTESECMLLQGEEPPDIAALREAARGSREWTASADDELDSAMDALLEGAPAGTDSGEHVIIDVDEPPPGTPSDDGRVSPEPFLPAQDAAARREQFSDDEPPATEPARRRTGPPPLPSQIPVHYQRFDTMGYGDLSPATETARRRTGPPPLPTVTVSAGPEKPGAAPRVDLDFEELEETTGGMLVDEDELIRDEPPAAVRPPFVTLSYEEGPPLTVKAGSFASPLVPGIKPARSIPRPSGGKRT